MTEDQNLFALKKELELKLATYTEQLHRNDTCNLSELNATLSALYKLKQIQSAFSPYPAPISYPSTPGNAPNVGESKSTAVAQNPEPPAKEIASKPVLEFSPGARIPMDRGYTTTAKVAKGTGRPMNNASTNKGVSKPNVNNALVEDVWTDNLDQSQRKEYPTRQDYQQPYEIPSHNQLTKDNQRQSTEPQRPELVQESVQEEMRPQQQTQPLEQSSPEVYVEQARPIKVDPVMPVPMYQQQMEQQHYRDSEIPSPQVVQRVVIRQSTMLNPVEQMMHDLLSAAGVPPGLMEPTLYPPQQQIPFNTLIQQNPGYGNPPPPYYR